MKTITVDFTNCKSHLQIHLLLKETFGFPEHYGKNLDALWDCLWEYCYSPARVLVTGANSHEGELKEYFAKILTIFERLHQEDEDIIIQVIS